MSCTLAAAPGRRAHWRRRAAGALLCAAWFTTGLAAAAAAEPMPLAGAMLHFTTPEQARIELARDDDWVAATSEFQRATLVPQPRPVSRGAFREALAATGRPWTPTEQSRWRMAAEQLAPRLADLQMHVPETVQLVLIDGGHGAILPHTRGNAIFLPADFVPRGYSELEVLAHELFHVLSRSRPALADRLYALFGFEAVPELEWPTAWAEQRLANPDAPRYRHAIRLQVGDETLRVMPVLVARRTTLEPGETQFHVMDVRLLVLQPASPGQPSRAQLQDGQPRWLPAFGTPAYLQRLGGNTRYVIHPEEIAADHFTFLVSRRPVPNPELMRQFETLLRSAPLPEERKP